MIYKLQNHKFICYSCVYIHTINAINFVHSMILKYINLGTLSYRNFYALGGLSLGEIDSNLREFLDYEFNVKYKLHDKVYLVYTDSGARELEADSALNLIEMIEEGVSVKAITKLSCAQHIMKESHLLAK